nr:MAG TPA: hypothetical protein [Caudoviricetes sp.]
MVPLGVEVWRRSGDGDIRLTDRCNPSTALRQGQRVASHVRPYVYARTCARRKPRIRFYTPCIEKYELRTVIYTHNTELHIKNYTKLPKYYILNIYYIHIYIIYYEENSRVM